MRPHGRQRARSYVPAPGKHLLQTPGQCAVPGPRHTRHRHLTGSLSGTPTQSPGTCSHSLGPMSCGPGAQPVLERLPRLPSGLTSSSSSRVGRTACAAAMCGREGVPREGTSSANRTPSAEHLGPATPPAGMSPRATPQFPGRSALSFLPVPTGSHPTSEPWPCEQMQRPGQTGHSGHTQQPRSCPQPRAWPAPVLVTVGPAPTPRPTASPGGCNHTVAAPPGEARAGAQPGNSQASPQHSTATRPPSPAGRAGHLQLGSPEGNLCLWPAAP